jgi:tetratricopeptide (TPR) repeat protein
MKISPEMRQRIREFRSYNPQLASGMSDEDIVLLLQQADLTFEHGQIMKFLVQDPDNTKEALDKFDPSNLSAHECGVYGEELLYAGKWFEAERYFLSQLEKGKLEDDLNQQALAYISLGSIYDYRGAGEQALMLFHHALSFAERMHNLH